MALTKVQAEMGQSNAPAFSTYQSGNQTFAGTTWTKVLLQTEIFDTASAFDSTTNYRFTPTVAGYYQVNAGVAITSGSTVAVAGIYKNGAIVVQGNPSTNSAVGGVPSTGSTLTYLNGSTDYIELYVWASAGATTTNADKSTFLSGSLVRTA